MKWISAFFILVAVVVLGGFTVLSFLVCAVFAVAFEYAARGLDVVIKKVFGVGAKFVMEFKERR